MGRFAAPLIAALVVGFSGIAYAAGPIEGGDKQSTNWSAILMFVVFVCFTLGITYWAASRPSRPRSFIRPGAASPVSRTASRLPATTCPPRRSWAFRA